MNGTEELVQRGYLRLKNGTSPLQAEQFGNYGIFRLGQTSLATLRHFLDINPQEADDFLPQHWHKPKQLTRAKPDTLIVHSRSIIAVVEHKTSVELEAGVERRIGLEQLQTYILACKAKVGILTDGIHSLWVHNTDPRRKNEIKLIHELGALCSRKIDSSPQNLDDVLAKLDHLTDEVSQPPSFDPSTLARSIWQDVYIATRQDPAKCFQTFVELFMYKLMSDASLLPVNLRLGNLIIDADRFRAQQGCTQIEFYFASVRPRVKNDLFVPMNTSSQLAGLTRENAPYISTKELLPTLDESGGETSVIDGHAFQTQPADYNIAFLEILKKLNGLPPITRLDPGFKSRVYEQFLRKDPNTFKVTGKYFTPRNVVKAIVQMAEVLQLSAEAVICDPAAGVGGFLTETMLELERHGILNYRENSDGRILVQRKLIGLEVLYDVVSLAKANFLLHCFEFYNQLSSIGRQNFSHLMADVFVQCHEDQTLGTLKHRCESKLDLVLANPPYMVSGTKNITQKIKKAGLGAFYDAGGSGLESRFLNWIVKALKPGGRGFVILPKSMLARVNTKFKKWIRQKCTLDAVIYLPERTFYTTPNPTYIFAFSRKHNDSIAQTDPVFCYYIRDIGETRDTYRNPTRNDLIEMVDEFRAYKNRKATYRPTNDFCKVVDIKLFEPGLRWDMDYLWTPSELAALAVVDTNVRPYEALIGELQKAKEDLEQAKISIDGLITKGQRYVSLSLKDSRYFRIHRGTRITDAICKKHPGDVPVVSSGRHADSYLGTVSAAYLQSRSLTFFSNSPRIMTVGCTGAVGTVHMRKEIRWFLHDDALAVEVVDNELVPEYVRCALQRAIDVARFDYTAKLYQERLKSLQIEVPVDNVSKFDGVMQAQIAEAFQHEEEINARLRKLAQDLQSVSVQFTESTV